MEIHVTVKPVQKFLLFRLIKGGGVDIPFSAVLKERLEGLHRPCGSNLRPDEVPLCFELLHLFYGGHYHVVGRIFFALPYAAHDRPKSAAACAVLKKDGVIRSACKDALSGVLLRPPAVGHAEFIRRPAEESFDLVIVCLVGGLHFGELYNACSLDLLHGVLTGKAGDAVVEPVSAQNL